MVPKLIYSTPPFGQTKLPHTAFPAAMLVPGELVDTNPGYLEGFGARILSVQNNQLELDGGSVHMGSWVNITQQMT